MDFTKKVNELGLFSNILVVNNDVMESVSATNTEDEEEVLVIAADITSKAVRDQIKDGKLTTVEGLLASIEAADSTKATLITPNLKDIKLFTEAVIKTAEDGNMSHMKDYVHETGNNIPQDIWDYIYKLTSGKQFMTLLNIICGVIPIIVILALKSEE